MAEQIAIKVGEEIASGVVAQIKQQFSYLSQYHNNIDNLGTKVETLTSMKRRVEERVAEARRNSEEAEDDVKNWLVKVDVLKAEVEGILKEKDKVGKGCWKGWCLNMKLRYRLSRQAVKEALPKLDVLLAESDKFVTVTVAKPQLPLGVVYDPTCSSEIETAAQRVWDAAGAEAGSLRSRFSILTDVMEAIRDDQIRIVRICGMGGVGKTTMAKQVQKMATAERCFNEIAMVEVNQEPDLKSVQLHIAELLGLKLEEDSLSTRAQRVRERLNDATKKILVILDNVWSREDLDKVGIPLEDQQSHCKILLTSRLKSLCKDIARGIEFNVEVLPYEEAMILFHQSLGDSPCYDQKAEELVMACGGLPISIKTIARAVANKTEVEWTVALKKLQKSALKRQVSDVFNCLKVSYDFLKNEEIKKFFRLCSLFRKGSDVPIEDLARYGMALGLFPDTDKFYEARDESRSYAETLLRSNLWMHSDKARCVKVHDHVWDFAVSAISNDLFMVNHSDELTEWPRRDSYEEYTSISLLCSDMNNVPEGLDCRNLKLLQLTGKWGTSAVKFPERFYEGMGGLHVLAFTRINPSPTPNSLQLLSNLRTLSLHHCSLGDDDVSIIGNLGKLEVLSFSYSNIEALPIELGKLKGLRLLDLTGCRELDAIAPHVLSSLTALEELYMIGIRSQLSGSRAVLSEITSMSRLCVLEIKIPSSLVLPMDSLFIKLKKFKIYVDTYGIQEADEYLFDNTMALECDSSVLHQHGIKSLLPEAETINLKRIVGLTTLLQINKSETVVFPKLKSLSLKSCNELMYVVNAMDNKHQSSIFPNLILLLLMDLPHLVDIFYGWNPNEEFNQLAGIEKMVGLVSTQPWRRSAQLSPLHNLKVLHIYCCDELEHIFTLSAARGLIMLERMSVHHCENMKVIFWKGRDDEGKIRLPNLKYLSLYELPKLVGCYNAADEVEFPQLEELILENIPACKLPKLVGCYNAANDEVEFPQLEELIHRNVPSHSSLILPKGETFASGYSRASSSRPLSNLKSNHIPVGFAGGLHHLQSVSLSWCESLEVVFDFEELIVESGSKVAMHNKLEKITIGHLPRMTHVWKKVPKNFEGFQNLTNLEVDHCDSLRYLFSPSIAKCLVKLKSVTIKYCEVMEEVISKRDEEEGRKNIVDVIVFFPQLDKLRLSGLPSLKCIGPGPCGFHKLSSEYPNVGSTRVHHTANANASNSTHNFSQKIALNSLEDTEIRGSSSMELWKDHHLQSGVVYGVTRMSIYECNAIHVLPHLIRGFHHLRWICIKDSESLEVVFDLDEELTMGRGNRIILNNLRCIELSELPKMTHVWKKAPKYFHGFENLTALLVDNCNSLRYLLSPSIAKCLVKLQYFAIQSCEAMEEFISASWDEEYQKHKVDAIFFPNIRLLRLDNLPSLVCLGPASSSNFNPILSEKIAFTNSLEDKEFLSRYDTGKRRDMRVSDKSDGIWRDMRVLHCDKLSSVFSSHLTKGFHHLEKLMVSYCKSLEIVFDVVEEEEEDELVVGGRERNKRVVMMNQLDEIRLEHLPRLAHVWKNVFSENFEGFHNLTILEVKFCGSLRYLFSPLIAKCLVKLQELSICCCDMMEEVVSKRDEEIQDKLVDMIFFPGLRKLELTDLPSLTCLGPYRARADFDKPSIGVGNVVETVDQNRDQGATSISTPVFDEKKSSNPTSSASVTLEEGIGYSWSLNNLTSLTIRKCHKLSSLFPPNREVNLPVLQHLSIQDCDNLKYVFSSSTVRSLAQLRNIRIRECEMMEVIVKDDKEMDGRNTLVFPSLTSLTLTFLPNLEGVCLGTLDFVWPSLTSATINCCWKMRIFSSGYSTTPLLDGLLVNSNLHVLEEGDVNRTFMNATLKSQDVDDVAFKEEGIVTISGFRRAGEHLVAQCRGWSWESVYLSERNVDLPKNRQLLTIRNVPCLTRARADSSPKNDVSVNPRPRTYDVSITYDSSKKSPVLWLKGFDNESETDLPLELVLEDIAEFFPQHFVAVEVLNYKHGKQVTLSSWRQPSYMKVLFDYLTRQGFEPNVQNHLQLLMDSLIPTIQYCVT